MTTFTPALAVHHDEPVGECEQRVVLARLTFSRVELGADLADNDAAGGQNSPEYALIPRPRHSESRPFREDPLPSYVPRLISATVECRNSV